MGLLNLFNRLFPPRTSIGALRRGLYFGQRAQDDFLVRCKGTHESFVVDRLIEDIPSIVSPDEERRLLETSRDIADAEDLIKRAIELERHTPGRNQAYNLANAYNKLGYHYRFTRRWQEAIDCFEKSFSLFQDLQGLRPENPDIRREMATARFHLGQVYMALYRESGDLKHKEQALQNLQESIRIDEADGRDAGPSRTLKDRI